MSVESEDASRRTGINSNVLGVLWMLVAVSLLTGMFGIAKVLMQTMPIAEVGMFRFLTSLLFMLPWVAINGIGVLKTERPFAHFWRAFFGATSLLAGIYAVHHMLLADATVLTFTIPLWSIIMAALFLGEKIRFRRALATIIGFGGILLVVKPQTGIEPAAMVALLAAILATCALTTMKNLTKTEPSNRIVFYFLFYGFFVLAIPASLDFRIPQGEEWFWLLALGFVGSTGQYCLTRAYAAGEMTIIAPMDYLRIIIAVGMGIVFFDEFPDAWAITGGIIVLASCGYIVRREAMLRKEAASENSNS
ncbi:MAG: EamA family transporter [Alphaproteobacteria bacterium]|nr:EamA family transporter [Alphaproteobacteria bacterium]